jgi:hypothetical protein
MSNWTEPNRVLGDWALRARAARNAHRTQAKSYALRHMFLGYALVVIPVLAATAWVQEGPALAAILCFLVTLLAAVQKFGKFEENVARHELIRAGYAAVVREIEHVQSLDERERKSPDEVLSRIRKKLDDLGHRPQQVSDRLYERSMAGAEQESDDLARRSSGSNDHIRVA